MAKKASAGPSKSTIDFATRQQIREASNVKIARERGRQQRAATRAREKAARETAAERSRLNVEAARQRAEISAANKSATISARRKSPARRITGAVTSTAGSATSGASNTSAGQIIIFVLLLMGGLIVFYNLVSRPQATNTKLGQLGGWLATLSTDKPLFKKNIGTKPAGTSGNTGSSGGNVA